MCKVLVMGGNQFLGKSICKQLLILGYEVYAFNRGRRENIENVIFLKGDRDNKNQLKENLLDLKVDIIIDVSGYYPEWVESLQEIMRQNYKHYIFISSASIYNNKKEFPVSEESSIGPNPEWGNYSKNKLLCEETVRRNSKKYGFVYTILRPFYIYGPGNNLDREQYIFSRIENNSPIFIPNYGKENIQFGYIDDLVSAIIYTFENRYFYNKEFNISGDEWITIDDFVKLCYKITKKQPLINYVDAKAKGIKARDWFPFRSVDIFGKIDKIQALKFKNKLTLEDGLIKTLEYLKKKDLLNNLKITELEKKWIK